MPIDNTYNTSNYEKQGGSTWVIGGELDIEAGGKQTAAGVQAAAIADHPDPTTATTTQIATKQNAILAALRGVGIIAP
jgi:hypothetical protein